MDNLSLPTNILKYYNLTDKYQVFDPDSDTYEYALYHATEFKDDLLNSLKSIPTVPNNHFHTNMYATIRPEYFSQIHENDADLIVLDIVNCNGEIKVGHFLNHGAGFTTLIEVTEEEINFNLE